MADPVRIHADRVTTTEARLAFNRNVAAWVKLLEDNGLRSGSFKIQSRGLHEVETMFEVGVHADAFEALGYEVVSHAVLFAKTPAGDVTVTSLFVRKVRASVGNEVDAFEVAPIQLRETGERIDTEQSESAKLLARI